MTRRQQWEEIKERGSGHYKSPTVQPIDLFRAGGMLRDFAIANIIKYAYRNRRESDKPINVKDLEKIKHYADMLIFISEEEP